LINLRERKNGNKIINIKRHLKNLRTRLQVNLYLLFQREKKKFRVKTNTSGYAIRRVLSQKQEGK